MPAIIGVALELPVSARSPPPVVPVVPVVSPAGAEVDGVADGVSVEGWVEGVSEGSADGSVVGVVSEGCGPGVAVLQSRTPSKVSSKPFGPVIVNLYASSSASGTVTVFVSPAAIVYEVPFRSKVQASSPSLEAMISRPPLAQSFATVTAGTAPFFAQVAEALALTVESLELTRIRVCEGPSMETKARPSGTLVVASAVSSAVPSAVPAGTSKKTWSPFLASETGLPSLSTTWT